jgi:hypothetical protein
MARRGGRSLSARRAALGRQSDGTAICSFAFTRDADGNILTSEREEGWWWGGGTRMLCGWVLS